MITIIAIYVLVFLLIVLLFFHIGILLKIIPYTVIWGGRLKSDKEMVRFELVSILINLMFLFIILLKSNHIAAPIPRKIVSIALWIMTCLFVLNTVGNLHSKNPFEKKYFTIISMILALATFMVALSA